jgi:hypothetical protein
MNDNLICNFKKILSARFAERILFGDFTWHLNLKTGAVHAERLSKLIHKAALFLNQCDRADQLGLFKSAISKAVFCSCKSYFAESFFSSL